MKKFNELKKGDKITCTQTKVYDDKVLSSHTEGRRYTIISTQKDDIFKNTITIQDDDYDITMDKKYFDKYFTAKSLNKLRRVMMDNTQFDETLHNLRYLTLDELLDQIYVIDEWENQPVILKGWYAVVTDLGIIAYFGNINEAFKFRLDYINRILNR